MAAGLCLAMTARLYGAPARCVSGCCVFLRFFCRPEAIPAPGAAADHLPEMVPARRPSSQPPPGGGLTRSRAPPTTSRRWSQPISRPANRLPEVVSADLAASQPPPGGGFGSRGSARPPPGGGPVSSRIQPTTSRRWPRLVAHPADHLPEVVSADLAPANRLPEVVSPDLATRQPPPGGGLSRSRDPPTASRRWSHRISRPANRPPEVVSALVDPLDHLPEVVPARRASSQPPPGGGLSRSRTPPTASRRWFRLSWIRSTAARRWSRLVAHPANHLPEVVSADLAPANRLPEVVRPISRPANRLPEVVGALRRSARPPRVTGPR